MIARGNNQSSFAELNQILALWLSTWCWEISSTVYLYFNSSSLYFISWDPSIEQSNCQMVILLWRYTIKPQIQNQRHTLWWVPISSLVFIRFLNSGRVWRDHFGLLLNVMDCRIPNSLQQRCLVIDIFEVAKAIADSSANIDDSIRSHWQIKFHSGLTISL